MPDIKKVVEGIIAFVNFFVVRIAIAGIVVGVTYRVSGPYYFEKVRSLFHSIPFTEEDFKSFMERASQYVTESNVKNAIFGVTLIVGLSLLDIIYRLVVRLGSLLPLRMLYDYSYVTRRYRPVILQAWKFHAKQYGPLNFIGMFEGRAREEVWKNKRVQWWTSLFDYVKSFIVFLLLLYAATPRSALKVSFFDVLLCIVAAVACLIVCTSIESARIAGDMMSALSRTTESLSEEAKEQSITDDEFEQATKELLQDSDRDWWREDWSGKFFSSVKLTLGIPYIVTGTDLRRGYSASSAMLASWWKKGRKAD